jgi:EAL domain-containing protein (putative c-di-GMP-specific phosphodiesterase class I)
LDIAGAAGDDLIQQLDVAAAGANLAGRSDALNQRRVAATVFGVAIELFVAGIALFFVRRYGLNVARDNKRRAQATAERLDITASLRTLRTRPTPEETAAAMTDALRHLPGVDVAAVFQVTADGMTALALDGPLGLPISMGQVLPARTARYLRERSADGPWAERWEAHGQGGPDDLYAALGLKSRAFAPILADGDLIGLIGIATTDEDHGRHLVEDLPAVGEFASLAETILVPALVAGQVRARERGRIAETIASAGFRPVFQPVVELATGLTVGFEALTRFDDGSRPDVTFAAALGCDMGPELETATLEAAVAASASLPAGAWVSLNVSPAILSEGDTLVRLLAGNRRPVVLEVTEHEAIAAYAPLRAAMLRLGPGVRLAVDDAGAGVANFNHLVELRPDFVKIDIGLVRGVDKDASRQAVVAGLIHFAAKVGCQVIAEGVETAAERATVAELGVTLGQGYLLARPAPAEAWVTAAEPQAVSEQDPLADTRRSDPPAALVGRDGISHRLHPGRPTVRSVVRGLAPSS